MSSANVFHTRQRENDLESVYGLFVLFLSLFVILFVLFQNKQIENAIGNLIAATPSPEPTGVFLVGVSSQRAPHLRAATSPPVPTTAPPPPCPGNQVVLQQGAGCGCPAAGMVRDGDNCSCIAGFAVQGAAECQGEVTPTQVLRSYWCCR